MDDSAVDAKKSLEERVILEGVSSATTKSAMRRTIALMFNKYTFSQVMANVATRGISLATVHYLLTGNNNSTLMNYCELTFLTEGSTY